MATLQQRTCTHCGQTFLTSDEKKCSLCGKSGGLVDPTSPPAMEVLKAKETQGRPPEEMLATGVKLVLLSRQFIRCVLGGIVGIGLGAMLLFHPSLRSDPSGVSWGDLPIAIGPLLVGVILLAAAYFIARGGVGRGTVEPSVANDRENAKPTIAEERDCQGPKT